MMCNLYSITTNQAAIIALFRVLNRYVGNLPPMPGVFPAYPAPAGRNVGAERELLRVMSRPGVSSFVDRKRFSFGRLLLKRTTTVYLLFHDCRSFEYDPATRRDRYIDARRGFSAAA